MHLLRSYLVKSKSGSQFPLSTPKKHENTPSVLTAPTVRAGLKKKCWHTSAQNPDRTLIQRLWICFSR